MKKVAVIGASGMVASRFLLSASKDFNIDPLDEKMVDITDKNSIENYFSKKPCGAIVNFAAYTNVDGAEKEKNDKNGLVWRLNVEGPLNLADYCNKNNVFLVHISTDYVFPGTNDNPGPYKEDAALPDTQDGMGWYGWTKNRAEHELSNSGARYAIVRYGYPFRPDNYEVKLDWARNLIKLFNENKLYPLFSDQNQNLLYIDDLARPLSKIISEELEGTFHIASEDLTTPFEAGKYLLEKYTGRPVDVQKSSVKDYLKIEGKSPRPYLAGLDCERSEKILGMKFRTWREMVDEFIEDTHE